MNLTPRHLQQLAAIDEHRSLVRAAKSLGISQPALSLSIKRIEDITKLRLVDRGRRGAQLTPAGKALARRGIEINVAISSSVEEINLLTHGVTGNLRIGGTPLSTNSIIPAIIGGVLELYGDVAIDVIEGLDEDLLEMLGSNELDVMIGAPGTAADRKTYETVPLFSTKTVLVVRANHPLLSRDSVSLVDLENVLWTIPPKGGAFRSQIEALFTVNSVPFPQKLIQASSVHVLKRIVACSDAVTLASEEVVRDEVASGLLCSLEVEEPIALRVFALHTRKDRVLSDLGKFFCEQAVKLSPDF